MAKKESSKLKIAIIHPDLGIGNLPIVFLNFSFPILVLVVFFFKPWMICQFNEFFWNDFIIH